MYHGTCVHKRCAPEGFSDGGSFPPSQDTCSVMQLYDFFPYSCMLLYTFPIFTKTLLSELVNSNSFLSKTFIFSSLKQISLTKL